MMPASILPYVVSARLTTALTMVEGGGYEGASVPEIMHLSPYIVYNATHVSNNGRESFYLDLYASIYYDGVKYTPTPGGICVWKVRRDEDYVVVDQHNITIDANNIANNFKVRTNPNLEYNKKYTIEFEIIDTNTYQGNSKININQDLLTVNLDYHASVWDWGRDPESGHMLYKAVLTAELINPSDPNTPLSPSEYNNYKWILTDEENNNCPITQDPDVPTKVYAEGLRFNTSYLAEFQVYDSKNKYIGSAFLLVDEYL